MQQVIVSDLGLMDYQQAWDLQEEKRKELVSNKLHNRDLSENDPGRIHQKHYLLFCEHPPVFTLGKSGDEAHLLLDENNRNTRGVSYYKINRGGDITFHGPGQLVVYPILDLDCFFTDVHKYVRFLEELVIRTLSDYGLEGIRIKEYTGVWLEKTEQKPYRKICAIGVHLSRWITMHGLAFNIQPDLKYFNHIIPCGINDPDKSVTSLSNELGKDQPLAEVKAHILRHFEELFQCSLIIQ